MLPHHTAGLFLTSSKPPMAHLGSGSTRAIGNTLSTCHLSWRRSEVATLRSLRFLLPCCGFTTRLLWLFPCNHPPLPCYPIILRAFSLPQVSPPWHTWGQARTVPKARGSGNRPLWSSHCEALQAPWQPRGARISVNAQGDDELRPASYNILTDTHDTSGILRSPRRRRRLLAMTD
jgi:hypothetical protein